MKQKWSRDWKSSVQPRKQRKYRHNAPLHVRRKFLGARLSPELTRQFGRRSMPIRKGDEIIAMRGSSKGLKGVVDRVDLARTKIYVEGIIVKKVDGSEVMKPLRPSNLMITKPSMDDKGRQKALARTEERAKELRTSKPKEKPKQENKKADPKPKGEKDGEAVQPTEKNEEPKKEKKIDGGLKKGLDDGMKGSMKKQTKDGI